MAAIAYDTLKLAKDLEAASFTPAQAEGLTKALAEHAQDTLAFKSDIVRLEASFTSQIANVTSQLANLTSQIASYKVETVKWIVAAIAFNFLGTAGLVIALVRGLR